MKRSRLLAPDLMPSMRLAISTRTTQRSLWCGSRNNAFSDRHGECHRLRIAQGWHFPRMQRHVMRPLASRALDKRVGLKPCLDWRHDNGDSNGNSHLLLGFIEHLSGNAKAFHRHWNPGIDSNLV
jgi:hypothetical protein